MDDRHQSSGNYRYGFQGQEQDDEVKGKGNSVNYKYRMHDGRIGRFFAVDPLAREYPYYSPYSFSGNRVVDAIELEGLEPVVLNGQIIGYEVKSGQGPSQVAADINNPETQKKYGYKLVNGKVDWKDIVTYGYNAKLFFPEGISLDPNDPQYTKLNLNVGDVLVIPGYNEGYEMNLRLREMYKEQLTEAEEALKPLEAKLNRLEAKAISNKKRVEALREEFNDVTYNNRYKGHQVDDYQQNAIQGKIMGEILRITMDTKQLEEKHNKLEREVKDARDWFNTVYYRNQENEEEIQEMESRGD